MTRSRYDRLAELRELDPVADAHRIYRTTAAYEFPLDMRLGLVLAFWRTFAVPSIAGLLLSTGETTQRTERRTDDTGILMYTLIAHGLDSPEGRTATRRLNQLHRRFAISNDDYLYVLGTFVLSPARWIDAHGWRELCCHERTAMLTFYSTLGRRMNITGIPATWESFEQFYDAYEAEHFAYTPAAEQLMTATRGLLPLDPRLTAALLDRPLREATGIAEPPWWARTLLSTTLTTRNLWLRHAARPRTHTWLEKGVPGRTYPDGYDLAKIGPEKVGQ
ncbi:oxygenase MpaB family protein [Winogradskya humida]|uniref:Peptidase n=1 Tax=Winogradskya humida TaxID=113566 RepID=A0ABQ3ZH01_9ACTN|nr:oxygenase MpaB family protein [Actinoplanes humidus]GIE17527.1 peptidase [Actinoplanes humidus]